MLTGLNYAWFLMYSSAHSTMELALTLRDKSNNAILVDDDEWAIKYQLAHFRAQIAQIKLMGPSPSKHISYSAKGVEDLTLQSQISWCKLIREGFRKSKKKMDKWLAENPEIFEEQYIY